MQTCMLVPLAVHCQRPTSMRQLTAIRTQNSPLLHFRHVLDGSQEHPALVLRAVGLPGMARALFGSALTSGVAIRLSCKA